MDDLNDVDCPTNWDDSKQKKGMIIDINNIALNIYKGLPSTAYAQLSHMFGKHINEDLICYTCIFHTHFCLIIKWLVLTFPLHLSDCMKYSV